jgi:hypothetical protein
MTEVINNILFLGDKIPNEYFGSKEKESPLINDQLLHFVIREKLEEVKDILANGSASKPSFEVLDLDSLFIILNDDRTHLNISIDNLEINGLADMQLKDIASNMKSRRVSALLLFPDVKIHSFYKINGILSINDKSEKIDDKGKLNIVTSQWRTSWSAKVLDLINNTIEVTQMAIRSHCDSSNASFNSFISKADTKSAIDLKELISSMLMDKIVRIVDEKLEEVLRDVVIERLKSQKEFEWSDAKSILDHHLSRTKRQVPCETGEELDEYVDSLFRFGRRLIRVMEPFSVSVY